MAASAPFTAAQGIYQSSSTKSTKYSKQLILTLPAVYHAIQDADRALQATDNIGSNSFKRFLATDLDVSRLNKIHKHLWLAGLPICARALHEQVLIGRRIIVTERTDLHLIWYSNTISIKPLPEYLLCHAVWSDILLGDTALFESANGMLLSYLWLICSRSDLKIAHENGLLPEDITWELWISFTRAVFPKFADGRLTNVNPRYLYGELRLNRLNYIYRFCSRTRNFKTFLRGYNYKYHRYSSFLRRNFSWMVVVVVYISVVLTAMQVGLGTEQLRDNKAFNSASYGFTVFSILAPLFGTMAAGVAVGGLVIFNAAYTFATKGRVRGVYQHVFDNKAVKEYQH